MLLIHLVVGLDVVDTYDNDTYNVSMYYNVDTYDVDMYYNVDMYDNVDTYDIDTFLFLIILVVDMF